MTSALLPAPPPSSGPRIALIGCGAVAAIGHAPALRRLGREPVALIDPAVERARALARAEGFAPAVVAARLEDVHVPVDAAVLCVPHHLHRPLCVDLLARGVHVLVEKPLALSSAECADILAAQHRTGAILAVGLTRRFLHAARWVKGALDAGALGEIERFEVEDGKPYDWPVASDFFFRRATAGGGVLVDGGAHMIDLVAWWLGDIVAARYADDDRGGVEAECDVELALGSGARGRIRLSRLRRLRGTARIDGRLGAVEVGIEDNRLRAWPGRLLDLRFGGLRGRSLPGQRFVDLFVAQLRSFLDAVVGRPADLATGAEAARGVGWIERCYAERGATLMEPWLAVRGEGGPP